jgi:hypothetical protein
VIRLTKGKRGTRLAVVASAGVVVGSAAPLIASGIALLSVGTNPLLLISAGSVLLYVVLVISSMWYWLK